MYLKKQKKKNRLLTVIRSGIRLVMLFSDRLFIVLINTIKGFIFYSLIKIISSDYVASQYDIDSLKTIGP